MQRDILTPEIISKIDNLHFRARRVVEGFIVGKHKSPYHGFSAEFSEHRAYGPGDEIKHIDWKLFGKTDRYYVKQFEEETNLRANLILDQSNSMSYGSGHLTKLDFAQTLLASIAYLMLKQQDAVGLTVFDTDIKKFIPPRSKSSHLNVLLSTLSNLDSGGETSIAPILHKIAEKIHKRGLIILVSDLFDNPKETFNGLKHFRHKGHEVVVFHILDNEEIELSFKDRVRFIDKETGQKITTDPWHIKTSYIKEIKTFCDYYKYNCRKNKIDYVNIFTNQSLDKVISDYLIKRNSLK
ncbi:MAG: DUF58 domain-containing protein [Candidatus Marinimicrobia bacterium]|nr:DUF58 domain-containing protein [Candidatus Neomarinimicrobiota bacterium]